jgi:hypothetical protein
MKLLLAIEMFAINDPFKKKESHKTPLFYPAAPRNTVGFSICFSTVFFVSSLA